MPYSLPSRSAASMMSAMPCTAASARFTSNACAISSNASALGRRARTACPRRTRIVLPNPKDTETGSSTNRGTAAPCAQPGLLNKRLPLNGACASRCVSHPALAQKKRHCNSSISSIWLSPGNDSTDKSPLIDGPIGHHYVTGSSGVDPIIVYDPAQGTGSHVAQVGGKRSLGK